MDPYAAHHALNVLEAHMTTPKDTQERVTVLQSFAVLSEIARLYHEATAVSPHE
ncbi:hypothetical protein ACFT8W_34675 [Streptomyces hygroscopicus]|uniref:hypothetical protein n=1 Tax=Streptomyces hygroscopicus TaxID=1912 RepID=UPI003634E4FA